MCGICFILFEKSKKRCFMKDAIQDKSRLGNRGPDGNNSKTFDFTEHLSAVFIGHVLHLRGDKMATQPSEDAHGNMLLWNGEIFGGINVPDIKSDTTVLLDLLSVCCTDAEITSLLAQIQGPWSFIYLQAATKTLWFGRDVFGRRSLLWHLPESNSDVFILSSVQIKPWKFKEIPSVGIFKMTSVEKNSEIRNIITLFPWKSAVWPGSLDPVEDTPELAVNLCAGELPSDLVEFTVSSDKRVPSQMPALNKSLPPENHCLPELVEGQSYLDYLQTALETNSYLQTLSRQLTNVLLEAVKTRVQKQHSREPLLKDKDRGQNVEKDSRSLSGGGNSRGNGINGASNTCVTDSVASCDGHMISSAKVAILFSGGIDSTVIAALANRCVPIGEPVDLLNVAFELKPKNENSKKGRQTKLPVEKKWDVPDRLTGYTALSELNPERQWNFIEVNVTAEQLQEARTANIQDLVYPLQTVLDDSIGCAVWFASRGQGILGNGPNKGANICSKARVVLCGMGADEQLVGYSRHRVRYKEEGWEGLINEIELEVTRISSRNLGRDDRIITDHGKESRFPFLDERVVQFLSALPVHSKADLNLPRGLGEKLLLRLSATELGLHQTATLAKRAIQFGSRIAKLENNKEKASDVCARLTNVSLPKNEL